MNGMTGGADCGEVLIARGASGYSMLNSTVSEVASGVVMVRRCVPRVGSQK